jgi:hypothetical protein
MAGHLPGLTYGLSLNQSTLPAGMVLGQIYLATRPDGGFAELIVVKAGDSLTANQALKFTDDAFTVNATGAAADPIDGCNDMSSGTFGTGAAVASGNYFLMSFRGNMRPLVAGATAAGYLMGSGTAGQLVAWTTGNIPSSLRSLVASGAGGATNAFRH